MGKIDSTFFPNGKKCLIVFPKWGKRSHHFSQMGKIVSSFFPRFSYHFKGFFDSYPKWEKLIQHFYQMGKNVSSFFPNGKKCLIIFLKCKKMSHHFSQLRQKFSSFFRTR